MAAEKSILQPKKKRRRMKTQTIQDPFLPICPLEQLKTPTALEVGANMMNRENLENDGELTAASLGSPDGAARIMSTLMGKRNICPRIRLTLEKSNELR